MKARIIDIEDSTITIKTENGKFITVPKKRLKFDCHINQNVILEKNEEKIYVLPDSSQFWEESSSIKTTNIGKTTSKPKNVRNIIIGLLTVASASALLLVPIINLIKNSMEENRKNTLSSCLQNALESSSMQSNYVECYKKHGGPDANERIAEFNELYSTRQANECSQKAEENYAVSDEEWEEAKITNDPNYIIMINTRLKNKAEAQKTCYKDVAGYDTSSLDALIKEVDSKNAALENIIESQKNARSYSSSPLHCSTQSIGSSTFIDCY